MKTCRIYTNYGNIQYEVLLPTNTTITLITSTTLRGRSSLLFWHLFICSLHCINRGRERTLLLLTKTTATFTIADSRGDDGLQSIITL